jgi:hypothetical protein
MDTAFIQHGGNILWIALICFIAIGLGKLTLAKACMQNNDSGETTIFSAALGFAIIAYGILLLGICQMLYPVIIYVFTGISSILSLAGWHIGKRTWKEAFFPTRAEHHDYGSSSGPLESTVNRSCLIILIISLLMSGMLVLAPETGKDALIYHIGVPKMFLAHHGIYFIPGNIFANYPFFTEMLYTWGLSISGEILPKGTHFAITLFILFSMWKFGKRYVHENSFEVLPLLIFFTIPSVFINAHTAYCDLILAFYTFVTIYAFINWFNTRQTLWLVLCAVFSGVAMSIKYGGLSFPFIGILGVLWACRQNGIPSKKAVHLLSLYILFTFITGSPFYLKNWVMTANPLYPLFYQIFGGKGWSTEQAAYYDIFIKSLGMGRNLLDYILLPWNLSFKSQIHSPIFDGLMGPVFILVLPFTMGMKRKFSIEIKLLATYCFLAFLFWASSAQQMRYLIPLFPFLAIVVSLVFSYYRSNRMVLTLLSIFILTGLTFSGYHIINDFQKIRPLNILLGRESKAAFLARNIPSYPMLRHVNTELPENAYIFTIYMKHLAYLYDRPFYSDSMFESYTMETILNNSKTPEAVWLALKRKGFTHVLYDINYVLGDAGTFSEENKKLFTAFQSEYLTLVKNGKDRYFLYRLLEVQNKPAS